MSGSIGSVLSLPSVAGYGTLSQVIADAASVRRNLDTLTQQAASGLVADDYAGLGTAASTSLSLAPAIAENQATQNNINAVSGQMQVSQTALSQISSIASTFYADCNNLNGLSTTEVDSTAAQAQAALQQVAGLLDSTDGSTYVFAGQDASNPPVPQPDGILTSGFYTQIAAAVGNLGTAGAPATIASTLATASSNATGTSPFSTALSQPAAALAAFLPSVPTGNGQTMPTGILASANASVTSTGTSTTGSYMRDILRALATIGSLSSSQISDAGFSQLVSDTQTSLGGAISALNEDAGVMGNNQTALTTAGQTLGDVQTALQTQLSNTQDVDMASTLSQLTATQTQLQASYEAISRLQSLSLTTYLTTTTA